MTDVPDKTIEAARQVADQLDQRGHAEHAGRLRAALAHNHSAKVLRSALGEACQVVLTAIEAIDKIRDTAESHARLFIVEVMGRDSGLIALRTGIGAGAENVLIPDTSSNMSALFDRLENGRKDKSSRIVIVAEGEEPGDRKSVV